MNFAIDIVDINAMTPADVTTIVTTLSWKDSGSQSSIQKELDKRYAKKKPGPHPAMALALVRVNGNLVGWVGTRPWPEKFKGEPVTAQTVECFVDPAYRRRGIAKLGLTALLATDSIDKKKIVAVYAPEVVRLAEQCGCKIVIFCDA